MPVGGGEARVLTNLPGGVDEFQWSPDSRRLAVIASDPERPAGAPKPKNPPPIVTARWQFKKDGDGYLDARRSHLYVHDVARSESVQITSGDHDEALPAWSPDGKQIAYVTRRGGEPDRHSNFDIYLVEPRAGAAERRLTTFDGADNDPDLESPISWSPDGRQLAFVQGGEDKWIYYAPNQLAIVDVATGRTRVPAPIDRWFRQHRWSPDGRSVLALIDEIRVVNLSRIRVASGKVPPPPDGRTTTSEPPSGTAGRPVG